MLSFEQP